MAIMPPNAYVPEKRAYRRDIHRKDAITWALGALTVFPVMAWMISPVLLIGAVPLLALAWTTWRISILLSSDGVTVRNMIHRRRFIPWTAVDCFAWGIVIDPPDPLKGFEPRKSFVHFFKYGKGNGSWKGFASWRSFFHYLLYGRQPESWKGGVKLVDGSFVRALVISAPQKSPGEVPALVSQLNEELGRAREAAGLPATNLGVVAPRNYGESNLRSLPFDEIDSQSQESRKGDDRAP
jgi:hypothetical protein